ncbi:MAG TPA: hypothetical protein HPP80_02665 [Rhodospirillaceae bacterium]|nr:hypothetical protein [Rhodospirillaceae bacterium]
MELTPLSAGDSQIIHSYGDGGFRISGIRYEGSVLLFPSQTLAWPVQSIEDITLESLAELLKAQPKVEIFLLGTGRRMLPLAAALRRSLRDAGMSVDAMDTGAACRTYNVLLVERRRVAAALIAVD